MHERIQDGALTEVTLFVLLSLYQPNHGYGIMQFVKQKTKDRVQLGAGTLYGAINTLEKKQWITEVKDHEPSRKKQYRITDLGKAMVKQEEQRMRETLGLLEEITRKEY